LLFQALVFSLKARGLSEPVNYFLHCLVLAEDSSRQFVDQEEASNTEEGS
jgi:hypothetical protein